MLLTAQELAQEFNVSLAAIRKWTRQGLPAVALAHCTRFELEPARQWLAEKANEQRRKRQETRQAKLVAQQRRKRRATRQGKTAGAAKVASK